MLTRNLEQTLHRTLSLASDRKHKYATLEHFLLGMVDDPDAAVVLRASGVDLEKLRADLTKFLDEDLAGLAMDLQGDPEPTAGFQRVVQRAAINVQSSGRDEITGATTLVALFSERESHAVYFLQMQDMTRLDAVNFISHGIVKATGRSFHRPAPVPAPEIPLNDPLPPSHSAAANREAPAPAQPAAMGSPLTKIFVSYSHKDRNLVDRLQVHLRPMERGGLIERWDDRRISPGQKWREEIRVAIENAKVAILVVSADFLASDFIAQNELPPLLKMAADRGTHILPILASPSRFISTPSLSLYQAFNPPTRPMSAMTRTQREALLVSVADRIEQLL